MRPFLLAAVPMMMVVGCMPKNIAWASCESIMLTTADEWRCTVKGETVGQVSSIAFNTESSNQIAKVNIALRVTKGKLRIGYQNLSGEQHLLVTPDEPAKLEMQTPMHRERHSFTLFFEPVDGVVEGLTGTVNYSTP